MLQTKMDIALKKQKIKECPMFSGIGTKKYYKDVMMSLIKTMERRICTPSEYLTREDHVGSKLYIVETGTVHLFMSNLTPLEKWEQLVGKVITKLKKQNTSFSDVCDMPLPKKPKNTPNWMASLMSNSYEEVQVKVCSDGDYFGECALLGLRDRTSAKSQTYCDLFFFDVQKTPRLSTCIKRNPDFFRAIQGVVNSRTAEFKYCSKYSTDSPHKVEDPAHSSYIKSLKECVLGKKRIHHVDCQTVLKRPCSQLTPEDDGHVVADGGLPRGTEQPNDSGYGESDPLTPWLHTDQILQYKPDDLEGTSHEDALDAVSSTLVAMELDLDDDKENPFTRGEHPNIAVLRENVEKLLLEEE